MMRTLALLASTLALTACDRANEPAREASVFGSITPLEIMRWWHACDVPLVLESRPSTTFWDYHIVECREDLGGEPDLKLGPTVHGFGAVQQGWRIASDEQLRIYDIALIAPPDRFNARATALIRAAMPPTLQGEALYQLARPRQPDEHTVSQSMDITPEPHQHRPLMQRFFAGEVFSTSSISWHVSPILFIR